MAKMKAHHAITQIQLQAEATRQQVMNVLKDYQLTDAAIDRLMACEESLCRVTRTLGHAYIEQKLGIQLLRNTQ